MSESIRDLRLDELGERYGNLRLVNPRAEKLMRDSLERYGQISPVVVQRGCERYELLDGFKRLHAGRVLELSTLQVRLLDVGARTAKAAMLGLNWVSRSVSDLEEGWVVWSLCREDGLTQVEVGALVGRNHSWVSRRLSLVERLSDEAQSRLRLGLLTATMGRELARVPRGTQQQVLESVAEHGLGSREVAMLATLLGDSNRQEQERILRAPREALAAQGKGVVVQDPRLSKVGNQVLRDLSRMERACVRVVAAMSLEELGRLDPGDRVVLATAMGKAQRAGHQASEVLREAFKGAQQKRDDNVQQP